MFYLKKIYYLLKCFKNKSFQGVSTGFYSILMALKENPHSASDKAKRIEAMFTEIARKYDLNNRLHSVWQDQKWRKQMANSKTFA